ncbi:putative hemolysin [Halochromatium sp.]
MPPIHAHYGLMTLIAALSFAGSVLVANANSTTEPPSSTGAQEPPPASPAAEQGLANPASVNCAKLGGTLDIRTRPDGGQYGVCVFEDNRQCEEWALLRGHCPEDGIKITGYDNAAQIYCAITGGEVDRQAGTCLRADGKRCGLDENFAGSCPSG